MATIYQNKKDGKIVSFKFKAFLGRDEKGKQIFKCKTWKCNKKMPESNLVGISVDLPKINISICKIPVIKNVVRLLCELKKIFNFILITTCKITNNVACYCCGKYQ